MRHPYVNFIGNDLKKIKLGLKLGWNPYLATEISIILLIWGLFPSIPCMVGWQARAYVHDPVGGGVGGGGG
jgi:hypothetical protein